MLQTNKPSDSLLMRHVFDQYEVSYIDNIVVVVASGLLNVLVRRQRKQPLIFYIGQILFSRFMRAILFSTFCFFNLI